MVYSTRRFGLSLTLFYFVLVFFKAFTIAITSLGGERANLSAFRTFGRFTLVWFCLFPFPLFLLAFFYKKGLTKDHSCEGLVNNQSVV